MRALTARACWGCWLLVIAFACAEGVEADIDPAETAGSSGKGGSGTGGGSSAGTSGAGKSSSGGTSGLTGSGGGAGSTVSAGSDSGGSAFAGEAGADGAPGGSGATSAGGDVTGGGGEPGSAGEPGVGSGGASGGTCVTTGTPYKVQVWNCRTGVNTPGCSMRIVKTTSGSVPLADLRVSYWISNEETAPWTYVNTTVGRHYPTDPYYDSDAAVSFDQVDDASSVAGADTRFDFTFTGTKGLGSIGANEDIEWGWYMSLNNTGATGDPTNDYSQRSAADPSAGGPGFDKVALYVDGTLVWGCEP